MVEGEAFGKMVGGLGEWDACQKSIVRMLGKGCPRGKGHAGLPECIILYRQCAAALQSVWVKFASKFIVPCQRAQPTVCTVLTLRGLA